VTWVWRIGRRRDGIFYGMTKLWAAAVGDMQWVRRVCVNMLLLLHFSCASVRYHAYKRCFSLRSCRLDCVYRRLGSLGGVKSLVAAKQTTLPITGNVGRSLSVVLISAADRVLVQCSLSAYWFIVSLSLNWCTPVTSHYFLTGRLDRILSQP